MTAKRSLTISAVRILFKILTLVLSSLIQTIIMKNSRKWFENTIEDPIMPLKKSRKM